MIERVAPAVEVCQEFGCKPTDQEITIALAQNGGFNAENLRGYLGDKKYRTNEGPTIINWPKVFGEWYPKSEDTTYNQFLNWRASGHNFDTWFMLKRYYENAIAFKDSGEWSMPEGVDWEYIKSLIENTPPASR
jgi:hypothetical protein